MQIAWCSYRLNEVKFGPVLLFYPSSVLWRTLRRSNDWISLVSVRNLQGKYRNLTSMKTLLEIKIACSCQSSTVRVSKYNMVLRKMNSNEDWTRVTQSNPLWVSGFKPMFFTFTLMYSNLIFSKFVHSCSLLAFPGFFWFRLQL